MRARLQSGDTRQRGMTLPEVLIALAIFAVIAAAGVYALRLGVDSRDQLKAADDHLKSLQIARSLIKSDLAQIVPRTVRAEFGDRREAVFLGNLQSFGGRREDDVRLLAAFVRDGWINPGAEEPRSTLQYVEYIFRSGALIRLTRPYVDEASGADLLERTLLDGLTDARMTYLIGESRGELEWADIWPVGAVTASPRAVALRIEQDGRATTEQYFWVGELGGRS